MWKRSASQSDLAALAYEVICGINPAGPTIPAYAETLVVEPRRLRRVQAILATLGYVLHPDGERVLLIRRGKRPDDVHFGYHNGLGGKLEPGEDVVAGMRREIREESGPECHLPRLAGTISWPGFGRRGENWFGFLFRIPEWSGNLRADRVF